MVKVERILCPTDLTPDSDEALRYAVALAREYDAKLLLCYCAKTAPAVAGIEGREKTRRHFERLFMDSLAPHLGLTDFAHLDWEGVFAETEDPGETITREAAQRRCDLIVMRSRRRPHAAALLGSTAETVCRTAPCSVLVTHPREREWVGFSAGDIDLRRVLVAHDFSDRSELALQYGTSLARKFGAELHLLHILREPEHNAPELAWTPCAAETLYHVSSRRLREAVPGEPDLGDKLYTVVLMGRPYERILSYASEHEVDLICIGADGLDHSRRALFGSNVDRVLRQAPSPVLVARQFKPNV